MVYEYQKTRHHCHPEEFYRGFRGILLTDGLQQYHMLEHLLDGFTSANCWAHSRRELPKGKTAKGLNYSVNQEKYLKVFLEDGYVPIDNSAAERSIRSFTTGRRNWIFINSIKGADASAVIYSISETAKLNNLNPYFYFRHILTELAERYKQSGELNPADLDDLLPWSDQLPEICHKPERR